MRFLGPLGILLVAVAVGATAYGLLALFREPSQEGDPINKWLRSWDGKEISQLSEQDKARFIGFVQQRLLRPDEPRYPLRNMDFFMDDGLAYVWKFAGEPKNTFLVLLTPSMPNHPSSQLNYLFIVAEDGHLLKRFDFGAGLSELESGSSYRRVSWLSKPVLVQEFRSELSGDNRHGKLYFGFDGLRPALVRNEGFDRAPFAEPYWAPNLVDGPPYHVPSVDELEHTLRGSNEVKLVEALVWLTGKHKDESANGVVYHESLSDERAYARFATAPSIVRAVNDLGKSSNPYVRQLAQSIAGSTRLSRTLTRDTMWDTDSGRP